MTQPEAELVTWKDVKEIDGRPLRHAYYLAGMRGTVQFVYMTYALGSDEQTQATDLGYHSPVPLYAGQRMMAEQGGCDVLLGPHRNSPCYYDGSGLMAQPVLALLQAEGEEAVWQALKEYYFSQFYDGRYEAGYDGAPYRTPEETQEALLQTAREVLELRPDPDLQAMLDAATKETP